MTEHWTTRFIGLPYAIGGQGPEAYNCLGFVRHVEHVQFGRELPPLPSAEGLLAIARAMRDHTASTGWAKVAVFDRRGTAQVLIDRPRSGDIVMMAHLSHPTHVGIWVDDVERGAVLHLAEGAAGSACHPTFHLRLARWRLVDVYRPASEIQSAELL